MANRPPEPQTSIPARHGGCDERRLSTSAADSPAVSRHNVLYHTTLPAIVPSSVLSHTVHQLRDSTTPNEGRSTSAAVGRLCAHAPAAAEREDSAKNDTLLAVANAAAPFASSSPVAAIREVVSTRSQRGSGLCGLLSGTLEKSDDVWRSSREAAAVTVTAAAAAVELPSDKAGPSRVVSHSNNDSTMSWGRLREEEEEEDSESSDMDMCTTSSQSSSLSLSSTQVVVQLSEQSVLSTSHDKQQQQQQQQQKQKQHSRLCARGETSVSSVGTQRASGQTAGKQGDHGAASLDSVAMEERSVVYSSMLVSTSMTLTNPVNSRLPDGGQRSDRAQRDDVVRLDKEQCSPTTHLPPQCSTVGQTSHTLVVVVGGGGNSSSSFGEMGGSAAAEPRETRTALARDTPLSSRASNNNCSNRGNSPDGNNNSYRSNNKDSRPRGSNHSDHSDHHDHKATSGRDEKEDNNNCARGSVCHASPAASHVGHCSDTRSLEPVARSDMALSWTFSAPSAWKERVCAGTASVSAQQSNVVAHGLLLPHIKPDATAASAASSAVACASTSLPTGAVCTVPYSRWVLQCEHATSLWCPSLSSAPSHSSTELHTSSRSHNPPTVTSLAPMVGASTPTPNSLFETNPTGASGTPREEACRHLSGSEKDGSSRGHHRPNVDAGGAMRSRILASESSSVVGGQDRCSGAPWTRTSAVPAGLLRGSNEWASRIAHLAGPTCVERTDTMPYAASSCGSSASSTNVMHVPAAVRAAMDLPAELRIDAHSSHHSNETHKIVCSSSSNATASGVTGDNYGSHCDCTTSGNNTDTNAHGDNRSSSRDDDGTRRIMDTTRTESELPMLVRNVDSSGGDTRDTKQVEAAVSLPSHHHSSSNKNTSNDSNNNDDDSRSSRTRKSSPGGTAQPDPDARTVPRRDAVHDTAVLTRETGVRELDRVCSPGARVGGRHRCSFYCSESGSSWGSRGGLDRHMSPMLPHHTGSTSGRRNSSVLFVQDDFTDFHNPVSALMPSHTGMGGVAKGAIAAMTDSMDVLWDSARNTTMPNSQCFSHARGDGVCCVAGGLEQAAATDVCGEDRAPMRASNQAETRPAGMLTTPNRSFETPPRTSSILVRNRVTRSLSNVSMSFANFASHVSTNSVEDNVEDGVDAMTDRVVALVSRMNYRPELQLGNSDEELRAGMGNPYDVDT